MPNPRFKIKPVSYVQPEPYIEWYTRDTAGITRTYAPLQVGFKVRNFDGLWGKSYKDIAVTWDFGDVSEKSWVLNSFGSMYIGPKDMNKAINPWAGHVYQSPGTYQPTATLRDIDGNTMTLQGPEVLVTSQDDYYASANGGTTYCISQDGDFTDAPPGSINITTDADGLVPVDSIGDQSGTPTSIDLIRMNKARVLFKRGQPLNYGLVNDIEMKEAKNCLIGAFGSGSRPVLVDSSSGLLAEDTIYSGVEWYHPFDPTQENPWWNDLTPLGRDGVEGVDWEAKDPAPTRPPQVAHVSGERTLVHDCYLNGAGSYIQGFVTISNTLIERYPNYGCHGGNIWLGSSTFQPEGTLGRPMGSGNCRRKAGWNTLSCEDPPRPVGNGVAHSGARMGIRPTIEEGFHVFSNCFFRAGGGHSTDGNSSQPVLRLDNSGETNPEPPQVNRDIGVYVGGCHIMGTISTSLAGALFPYGHYKFDSCVIEKPYDQSARLQLDYAIQVDNCLFLAKDDRAWNKSQSNFFSGPAQWPSQAYEGGNGDHSLEKVRLRNCTIAYLADGGMGIAGDVEDIVDDFPDTEFSPSFEAPNVAFFRVGSSLATTPLIPLAAPASEIDPTTYLPLTGTTFDTLENNDYPPLDFDGNVRTTANAIYGFRVKE